MNITVKVSNLSLSEELKLMLEQEGIAYTYTTKGSIYSFKVSDIRWLHESLVIYEIRGVDYVEYEGVKYDYLGIEML